MLKKSKTTKKPKKPGRPPRKGPAPVKTYTALTPDLLGRVQADAADNNRSVAAQISYIVQRHYDS